MRRTAILSATYVLVLAVVGAPLARAADETPAVALPPDWKAHARTHLGFSDLDLKKIDAEVVAREIPGESTDQVLSVFAAVRVRAPLGQALRKFFAEGSFIPSPVVSQHGEFGAPPSAADAASLQIPKSDVEALRSCRPGACKVKLSAAQIAEVSAIDWSDRNAEARVHEWLRRQLGEIAATYRAEGAVGLPAYADKPKAAGVDKAVGQLMSHAQFLYRVAPDIHRHLSGDTKDMPDGSIERLSWSMNEFGLRPVLFVTHSVIYPQPGPAPYALVADKHIYASHYFLARVELTGLLPDDRGPGDPGFYMVYTDRSLFDDSPGYVQRKLLVRDVLRHVHNNLTAVRAHLQGD